MSSEKKLVTGEGGQPTRVAWVSEWNRDNGANSGLSGHGRDTGVCVCTHARIYGVRGLKQACVSWLCLPGGSAPEEGWRQRRPGAHPGSSWSGTPGQTWLGRGSRANPPGRGRPGGMSVRCPGNTAPLLYSILRDILYLCPSKLPRSHNRRKAGGSISDRRRLQIPDDTLSLFRRQGQRAKFKGSTVATCLLP